jgi:hypothetical protein
VRTKYVGSVLLSILFVASLIALPAFMVTISSTQKASANPTQDNFTIVALPDTQNYSRGYPEIFDNQTEWIVQNENAQNIVFVAHLGDVVNNYNDVFQWRYADNAMSILDNRVPYGILPGNHDLDGGPSPALGASASEYEKYFPASRYEEQPYWGGSHDSSSVVSFSPNMNNYQLFSAGGMNFIALNLQYNPPADVLSWADNILTKYPNRRAIISTHSYLDINGNRGVGGPVIWRDLVVPHNNVFLVLCGHVYNDSGYGASEKIDNLDNRMVYQLLSDYQGMPQGGDGWLRIMEFVPSENTIHVKTYSPYLDNYWIGPAHQFDLSYSMSATAETSGGGISLMVYVGAIVIIVVIIAAVLATRQYKPQRSS